MTPQQRRAVAMAYTGGKRIKEITETFGVSRPTIYYALRVEGVPLDPARRYLGVRFDESAVVERYTTTQLTAVEIARELGISDGQVLNCLHRHGVEVEERRVYERVYDYAEIRRLHEEDGLTKAEIAKKLGCAFRLVGIALAGGYVGMQRSSSCVDCGVQVDLASVRCTRCMGLLQVKRDAKGRLWCSPCETWKDEEEFGLDPKSLRGRRAHCRSCETRARRRYRRAHPEKEQAANERLKARRRARKATRAA